MTRHVTSYDVIASIWVFPLYIPRVLRPYKCIFKFDDCHSAIQRLKEPIGDMYIFRYTKSTIEGYKYYYHCQGQQKCSKTVYILRHSDSLKASIWLCSMPHAHTQTTGGSLPQKSVNHIKKMFEEKSRYTNNEIINSLRRPLLLLDTRSK